MPVYEFSCPNPKCKEKDGSEKVIAIFRPMSQSGDPQKCDHCGKNAQRIYSFSRPKEFEVYHDAVSGTDITSERKERSIMKRTKRVMTRETPFYGRFKDHVRKAQRKPVFFTPAGYSSMNRD